MQAITAATLTEQTAQHSSEAQEETATPGWLTRIFGCWHREMSRPFTFSDDSYRVCLECGARRRFNPRTWEMTGPYYYEGAPSLLELYSRHDETVRVCTLPQCQRPALPIAA